MKIGKKIIVLTVLVFLFVPVFVQAVSFWPLVPCGLNAQPKDSSGVELPKVPTQENPDAHDYTLPCNRCDLLKLFKNIIDFVLYGLMPPAAAILFVWGGFLILMGGANPGWITQGKSIFWNTAIGVAIVSTSWLITNSIIRSVGVETVTVDGVVKNVATDWWKFECRVTTPVQQPPVSQPQPPAPVPQPGPGQPPAPQPPVVPANLIITTPSLSDARQNFDYSQTIQATGGKTPYNWSIVGSLPSGLMINSSTGEIFGKPTTSGNFTFTVAIQDSSSPVKSITKQLSIKVVTPASSVIISNVASSNVTANSATITWTTDKPSTSQVAYGTTTAYAPPTSLDSNLVTNHSVTLSGLNGNTTYNYQVISSITGFTARSSNNNFKTLLTSTQFSILISLLPDAVQGMPYSETIPLAGGQGPYTWSVIGTLPPGLTGNPVTGEISGTPTTAGTSTVTVKVEDSSSPKKSVTKQITIKVNPAGQIGDSCSNPQLLAQQHNEFYPARRSPDLNKLLSCISSRLGQPIPPDGGVNYFYGSIYTFDQSSVLCNYTRADKHCDSSCAHTINSCHYGGRTGTQGSLAVDFGNELKGDTIIQAAVACGVPTSKARCENAAGKNVGCARGSGATHIHISASTCDAN